MDLTCALTVIALQFAAVHRSSRGFSELWPTRKFFRKFEFLERCEMCFLLEISALQTGPLTRKLNSVAEEEFSRSCHPEAIVMM